LSFLELCLLAQLEDCFTRFFFWRLNGRSGIEFFFSGRRDGRSGTEIFFIGGRRLKNKKMFLVLIEFSGVSLHGPLGFNAGAAGAARSSGAGKRGGLAYSIRWSQSQAKNKGGGREKTLRK
jgi:hypothetical protein